MYQKELECLGRSTEREREGEREGEITITNFWYPFSSRDADFLFVAAIHGYQQTAREVCMHAHWFWSKII